MQRKQRPQPSRPQPSRPQPSRPQPSRPQPSRPQPSRPQPSRPQQSRPQPSTSLKSDLEKIYHAKVERKALEPLHTGIWQMSLKVFVVWMIYNLPEIWYIVLVLGFVLLFRMITNKEKEIQETTQVNQPSSPEELKGSSQQLPSQVDLRYMERVEWINTIISQMWPFIGAGMRDRLKQIVKEKFYLFKFQFSEISVGSQRPRIVGVKVYNNTPHGQVILDVAYEYKGDFQCIANISAGLVLKVDVLTIVITSLQITGSVRVVVEPLVTRPPFFGGLRVEGISRPEVDLLVYGLPEWLDKLNVRGQLIDYIKDLIVKESNIEYRGIPWTSTTPPRETLQYD
ncbi:extended synaptotagmin-3-like isoform X1 [Homarus americanus]|uniref:extended synaptotagmin-3-like isoform X1 n=2 Tax=Homarus americanus TaxID=6706 RepID=UPI001C477BBB|nr:extended synaptotagmin-3-like isoform X1 [Homarus americanus]